MLSKPTFPWRNPITIPNMSTFYSLTIYSLLVALAFVGPPALAHREHSLRGTSDTIPSLTANAIENYYSTLTDEEKATLKLTSLVITPHEMVEGVDYEIVMEPNEYNFHRKRGVVQISFNYMTRLKQELGLPMEKVPAGTKPLLQIVELEETSVPHIDAYPTDIEDPTKKRRVVDDSFVAFVMMNDNPAAFFQHGETRVPIVKGTMVKFAGNVPHNTVITSGSVRLLGPFDVNGLKGVGLAAELTRDTVSSSRQLREEEEEEDFENPHIIELPDADWLDTPDFRDGFYKSAFQLGLTEMYDESIFCLKSKDYSELLDKSWAEGSNDLRSYITEISGAISPNIVTVTPRDDTMDPAYLLITARDDLLAPDCAFGKVWQDGDSDNVVVRRVLDDLVSLGRLSDRMRGNVLDALEEDSAPVLHVVSAEFREERDDTIRLVPLVP